MAAGFEVQANEVVHIRLVQPEDVATHFNAEFHPEFSYQFYEDEVIKGHRSLRVQVEFTAGQLFLYIAEQAEDSQTRAKSALEPWIHHLDTDIYSGIGYTTRSDEFRRRVEKDAATFKPHGQKIYEYSSDEDIFEIYESSFESEAFQDYHRRLELFSLMFIDGARLLDADRRWRVFTLYQKHKRNMSHVYSLVGFASCYPFLFYPDKKRMRISQFVILPPYQNRGNGSRFYAALMDHFHADKEIAEVGVEQPNDDFQDMRDRCDIRRIIETGVLAKDEAPISPEKFLEVREKFKLSKMQAARCCEILLLKNCKTNVEEKYRAYRLFVKERLYRQNLSDLATIPRAEAVQQLANVYSALEEEYRHILQKI